MFSFRIINDNKCVKSTSKLCSTVNNNFVIIIDSGLRKICNFSNINSLKSMWHCLIQTTIPKIILAEPDSLSKDDRKILNSIKIDLIDLVKSISNKMKEITLPEFANTFSKFIHLKIIIKETLNDSMINYCIPYTRFSKVVKYEKDIETFFSEIFHATHPNVTKVYSSLIFRNEEIPCFLENLDTEDKQIFDNIIFSDKTYSK